MPEISLPSNWQPRWYQKKLWCGLEQGKKRGIAVCHRRWGKDEIALHWAAVAAHERPATYWHMLPEYSQARKAIWNAVNPHTGKRRIDEAFPMELRANTNEHEMFIRFKCGATWQVVGSDSFNSLVGAPPAGIVFSEFSLANPSAWAYMSPILNENGGWALFIYTSRGRNHGHKLYESHKSDPAWIVEKQDADFTKVFTAGQLDAERQQLIDLFGQDEGEALFQQEYYCSFDAAILGAYYGKQMALIEKEGRVKPNIWEPSLPVYTAWDLGLDDATSVWFFQQAGGEIRVIDYYEVNNQSLADTAKFLKSEKPYVYQEHILPHDVEIRELMTAKSRKETLESLGIRPITVATKQAVEDGINAVRQILPKCVFDEKKCERGIEALKQYRREWDDDRKTYRAKPMHDWTSHGADAFRYFATAFKPKTKSALQLKPQLGFVT